MEKPDDLMTLAEIARREGLPLHRVRYIADRKGISPDRRAGTVRLYSADHARQLADAARTVRPWTTAG